MVCFYIEEESEKGRFIAVNSKEEMLLVIQN